MTTIPFNSPTTAIISGPTGSRKSTFIFRIIENATVMFQEKVYTYIIFIQFGNFI